MPGTVIPDPVPIEQVTEQAQPSPSSTEMWVVEPSRSATIADADTGSATSPASIAAAISQRVGTRRDRQRGGPARRPAGSRPALGGGLVKISRPR